MFSETAHLHRRVSETAHLNRMVSETAQLNRMVDEIENEIFTTGEKEVPTSRIGELVMDKLKSVDQVAYVRFA